QRRRREIERQREFVLKRDLQFKHRAPLLVRRGGVAEQPLHHLPRWRVAQLDVLEFVRREERREVGVLLAREQRKLPEKGVQPAGKRAAGRGVIGGNLPGNLFIIAPDFFDARGFLRPRQAGDRHPRGWGKRSGDGFRARWFSGW